MSLAVLLALGCCSLAMAQRGGPGGRGGFGGGGSLGVLQDEKVRSELGILPEQYAKIQAINEKMMTDMRSMFSGLRDLSDDERQAKFAELREKMTARTADVQKQLNEILLPDQISRLEQISTQSQLRRSNTADALTNGAIAEKLGLTEADKERIRKVAEEADAELRTKTEQLREEAKQKIIAAMTPAQQAKFKELTGAPAEFTQQQFGRGGFGNRGGGTGGNRGGGGTTLQRPADGD
jgi:Spy/CpxP family protein refolding chaperone